MSETLHQAQLNVRKFFAEAHHGLRHDLGREERSEAEGHVGSGLPRQLFLVLRQLGVSGSRAHVKGLSQPGERDAGG